MWEFGQVAGLRGGGDAAEALLSLSKMVAAAYGGGRLPRVCLAQLSKGASTMGRSLPQEPRIRAGMVIQRSGGPLDVGALPLQLSLMAVQW